MSTALRLARRIPTMVWLIAGGMAAAPIYLRYFAWALGQCGVGFWAPVR